MANRRPPIGVFNRDASVSLESYDAETRTADLVWTTGATVRRRDFAGAYDETLRVDSESVDLSRLNSGAPLLNSHRSNDIADVIGVVVSAEITDGGQGTAKVRFSDAPGDAEAVSKITSGIVRKVSVGYRVDAWEIREPTQDGEVPLYTATRWTPFELSAVPIPADNGAEFRAADLESSNPVTNIPAAETATVEQDNMSERSAEEIRAEAAKAERARAAAIVGAARKLGLNAEVYEPLISDPDMTTEAAHAALIDARAAQDDAEDQRISSVVATIEAGATDAEKRREGMTNALLHRNRPDRHTLSEAGREYRGMSLMEMARTDLRARGILQRGWPQMRVAQEALRIRGGMHTSSDFPVILADVMNKTMETGYNEIPRTFPDWTRRGTARDFRAKHMIKMGQMPDLQRIDEHGEYTRGTIAETEETYRVEKYGRVVAVTWELLINDDLNAFTAVPQAMGQSAARLESDVVYDLLISNPLMNEDGAALFSNRAVGDNLAAAAAPSAASLSELRTFIRHQKNIGAAAADRTFLGLRPAIVLAPSDQETEWEQLLRQAHYPISEASAAPTASMRSLALITEERLSQDSAGAPLTGYYLISDPARIPVIEYSYLEGNETPFTATREGFDIDGFEFKMRHVFGAGVVDFRAAAHNPGV